MRCSKCGTEGIPGKKFCAECGSALSHRCSKCGSDNPPAAKYCVDCGASLAPSSAAHTTTPKATDASIRVTSEGASAPLEGERKTITALFADIKGSTELEQDLDPEEARTIVDPALKLMIDAVQRYDGYVVQSTGDGIFAIFGAPVAHEDHPQRALYAALRMQEELRRYGSRLQAEGRAPIEIRTGVNSGEVVVRAIATGANQVEYTPIGHTANLASRLQGIARTGSIVVSEATRKFCEGYFTLKPLGPTRMKGVTETVEVYEVTGLGPLRTRLQRSAGKGLTKFVGRQQEMDVMKRAAEQARAGRGQIVAAMAEAGVGKSRLFFEFKATSQSGWMVLEAYSVSHGKASPYLPVIDLLHAYFRIAGEDDQRVRREKVAGRLSILDSSLDDTRPYLFSLLGIAEGDDPLAQMDSQIRKRRTLEAIKRIALRESLNQPLMVIFEDLHWIDEETQAFLNLLVESIGNAKLLLLVNYRPEYSHQWNSKTYYTQLRLDPLGRESAQEMLDALLGDAAELAPLKRLIIERTEGTPFFMEEMVQALFEDGALARNGGVHLTRPLEGLKVPPTVQAILASRIDRLPAEEKDLLQTLALVGREFSLSLAREVIEKSADELDRMLNHLQLAEFMYEQPAVGDVEYIFKHALTQQVAQDSMLTERRKALHGRIAAAIESLYADRIDDQVDQLAHHYQRSGNAARAVEYLKRAGDRAAARSASVETVEAYLEAALEMLRQLPESAERNERELQIQLDLAGYLNNRSFGDPARGRALDRARKLSEKSGDSAQSLRVLWQLCQYHIQLMEIRSALKLAEQAFDLARSSNRPDLVVGAFYNMGETSIWHGDLENALHYIEGAMQLLEKHPSIDYRADYGIDLSILAVAVPSIAVVLSGSPERGLTQVRTVIERARTAGNLWMYHAGWLFCSATINMVIRDFAAVRSALEIGSANVAEYGFHEIEGWGRGMAAALKSAEGDPVAALVDWRAAQHDLESMGSFLQSRGFANLAAEIYRRATSDTETLQFIDSCLERLEASSARLPEAELCRIKGEIIGSASASDSAESERWLRRAVETSQRQGARWYELRATTSLARLLSDNGRRDDARAMLAEIYNWFTEGFDTADMKDAKALLGEL
jgi:class 3 adenylate cyclase/tetratricopeptide (TPR) repeat protein